VVVKVDNWSVTVVAVSLVTGGDVSVGIIYKFIIPVLSKVVVK